MNIEITCIKHLISSKETFQRSHKQLVSKWTWQINWFILFHLFIFLKGKFCLFNFRFVYLADCKNFSWFCISNDMQNDLFISKRLMLSNCLSLICTLTFLYLRPGWLVDWGRLQYNFFLSCLAKWLNYAPRQLDLSPFFFFKLMNQIVISVALMLELICIDWSLIQNYLCICFHYTYFNNNVWQNGW